MDPSKTKIFTISHIFIAFEKLLKTTHNRVTKNRYMYFLDSNKQLKKNILPLKVALKMSKECKTQRSSDKVITNAIERTHPQFSTGNTERSLS